MLKQAEKLAREKHKGQTDKAGKPYIEHIERVVNSVLSDDIEDGAIVAWLHDIVEDTDCTLGDLFHVHKFPRHIVEAVRAITHRPGGTLNDYLGRVVANDLARAVKIADLADNKDPVRLSLLPPDTRDRLRKKYQESEKYISDFLAGQNPEKEESTEPEYCIAQAHSAGGLEVSVNKKLSEGWRPKGGMSVHRTEEENHRAHVTIHFMQAMVKSPSITATINVVNNPSNVYGPGPSTQGLELTEEVDK